ncbi:hypothetical protein LUZ60_008599 [Juncus effusus]|nr:hypothetical protein LUZ60_008599 [Juncus effusus]
MNGHRSKSYADNRTEIEVYNRRATDLRSHSVSYCYPNSTPSNYQYHYEFTRSAQGDLESKKGKSPWRVSDPDFQRKRRVASYKAIGYQSKFKGSMKKGFKWLKKRYMQVVYGWY